MKTMKAITLWQPWASLLACGEKKFETRSWETPYRGPIAIHAAKKDPLSQYDSFSETFLLASYDPLMKYLGYPDLSARPLTRAAWCEGAKQLPRGTVIATAELVDCHRIVRYGGRGLIVTDPGWIEGEYEDGREWLCEPTEQELLFGDWTPGRFAWEFANMKLLLSPIPAKGNQRLWDWEAVS